MSLDKPLLVVGVGASAGGLAAAKQLFARLQPGSGLAFVVVLHIDPLRVSHLDEVLAIDSGLPVVQVTRPQVIEPDHIYVIAPNTALEIAAGEVRPTAPVERAGIGSGVIDHLFSSLASEYGPAAVAIVLSGIGSDGAAGVVEVEDAGGWVLAQTPSSAEHPEMPQSAIATGSVGAVAAPDAMVELLLARTNDEPDDASGTDYHINQAPSEAFDSILTLLASHHGFDARNYKKGTLMRRAQRRLALLPMADWDDYLVHVQEHPEELEALYQDVLIGVTEFFRDSDQWDWLERDLVPRILDEHVASQQPIRIWVVGCATGEEAYSLAIVFLEQLERRTCKLKLQVFATDVNNDAVAVARDGVYPASIAHQVAPNRLQQFFSKRGDKYQVELRLREVVTVAQHDLLADPPFSRIDLISCRNLLIYFELHAQNAAIDRLNFALQPGGVLWLGSAESTKHPEVFEPLTAKYQFHRKRPGTHKRASGWNTRSSGATSSDPTPARRSASTMLGQRDPKRVTRALELHLLEHSVQASVVVDDTGTVLHMFGPIADYLTAPVGRVRLDLLSWVREASLYAKLRPALDHAIATHEPVTVSNVSVRRGRDIDRIELTVTPIPAVDPGLLLIGFRHDPTRTPTPPPRPAGPADENLVGVLTAELHATHVELQSTREELEHTNQEYRASYEELLSLNEELQSSNNELETTKEEAQSVNEELLTVNRELEERHERLREVNADLGNLLALTTIPTVFLDRQLRVRRYTPAAERVMWLVPSDVGRLLQHIQPRVTDEALLSDVGKALEEATPSEAEVRAEDGHWYLRKIVPFRTGNQIEGICLIFYDITAQKLATAQSEEGRFFAESIVRASQLPFVVFDHQLVVVSANDAFYATFASTKPQVEGVGLELLCEGGWDIPEIHAMLDRVVRQQDNLGELELELDFARVGRRAVQLTASRLERPDRTPLLLLSIQDVTPLRDAQSVAIARTRELEQEHQRKDEFLAMLGHELRNPLAALINGLLLLEHVGGDSAQVAKIHPMLNRQTRRMTVMLDQLLDPRVTSGKVMLDLDRVDLVDVVNAAVEGVQALIAGSHHELELSLPGPGMILVHGDFVRLVQVVENLLANSAKYTEAHGRIWLRLDSTDGSARISVRDTGIGIDPELLGRVFEVFSQGEQQLDRSDGGLGLGLALVRQLVEMHGGRVEARSPGPGQGSEFEVVLPQLEPVRASVIEARPQPRRLDSIPSVRVLIVDDLQDAAVSLAALLTSYGHVVETAFDGHAVVEAAARFAPAVVLLDIGLPDIDGYEVATRLRARLDPRTRIVAVTGYGRDDARLREAGFDDHLVKPPSLERLIAVLGASN